MATDSGVTMTGFSAALDALERIMPRKEAAETALMAGALEIVSRAKANVHRVSGTLSRSIHAEPVEAEGALASVAVGTNLVYAAQHEFGGAIVPRTKRFLAWRDADGQWHVARRVQQPPHPFLRPALADGADAAQSKVAEVLAQMLEGA